MSQRGRERAEETRSGKVYLEGSATCGLTSTMFNLMYIAVSHTAMSHEARGQLKHNLHYRSQKHYYSFSKASNESSTMMKDDEIRITRQQCKASDTVPETHCASTESFDRRTPKMRIINVLFLRTISEIKLKRTDTTLDLSQKA